MEDNKEFDDSLFNDMTFGLDDFNEKDLESFADAFLKESEKKEKSEAEKIKEELITEAKDMSDKELEIVSDDKLREECTHTEDGRTFLFEKKEGFNWIPCQDKKEQKEYLIKIFNEYRASESVDTVNEVLLHNLDRMIKRIIRSRLFIEDQDIEDAVMLANIAILENIPKYDPNVAEPSTFFYYVIIHGIISGRAQEAGTTVHHKSQWNKIKKAINEFKINGIDSVTNQMIAEKTGLSETQVETEMNTHQFTFLGQIKDSDGETKDALEFVEAVDYLPDEIIAHEYAEQVKREVLSLLKGDEKEFALVYYGFKDTLGYFRKRNGEETDAVESLTRTCEYLGITKNKGRNILKNIKNTLERYRRTHERDDIAVRIKKDIAEKPKKYIPRYPSRASIDAIMREIEGIEFTESLVDSKKRERHW